jgi:hypothetical protein
MCHRGWFSEMLVEVVIVIDMTPDLGTDVCRSLKLCGTNESRLIVRLRLLVVRRTDVAVRSGKRTKELVFVLARNALSSDDCPGSTAVTCFMSATKIKNFSNTRF